ncbi:MAG: hypothetical protein CMA85_01320 [Euryarchaeota archaeon]|nr:hypothetical protein [Euryarchaeota archaeon]
MATHNRPQLPRPTAAGVISPTAFCFRRGGFSTRPFSRRNLNTSATNDYTKAIQLNPDDADAYYSRGIAYRNLGQYQTANAGETIACYLESSCC